MAEEDGDGAAESQPPPAVTAEEIESSSASESPSTFSFPSTAMYSSEDDSHDEVHFPLPTFAIPVEQQQEKAKFEEEDGFSFPGEQTLSLQQEESDSAASSGYLSAKDGIFIADRDISSGEIELVTSSGSNAPDQVANDADRDSDAQFDGSESVGRVSSDLESTNELGMGRKGNARVGHSNDSSGIFDGQVDPTEVDRHCDVLDLFRKGVQNWRTVARMSGWLACRGCCHKPASCCHSGPGGTSPVSTGAAAAATAATASATAGTSGATNGHSRKDSQDTIASSTTSSSACCSRKSTSSPLRSPLRSPARSPLNSITSRKEESNNICCNMKTCNMKAASYLPLKPKSSLVACEEIPVQVPPGMIGLAWLNSEPMLLSAKSYTFPSASFLLQELAVESSRVIHHGTLHRVLIPDGKLGVAWVDGQAKVLEPGIHVWSCSSFAYTTADDRDAFEKEVALGPFRVVTVKEDEVGVKYCNRKPQLLYAGRHLIDISKVEVFAGFESLRIRKATASDLVACTRDEIMGEAQVSFRWQIAPQDIALARAASVADIEGAVITKLRRAFAIVFWCLRSEEISSLLPLWKDDNVMVSGPMHAFSVEISKRCMEAVGDLFEEGWKVTFWGMWFESLKLRKYTRAARPAKIQPPVQAAESKSTAPRKKKVQIFVTED